MIEQTIAKKRRGENKERIKDYICMRKEKIGIKKKWRWRKDIKWSRMV